MNEAQLDTHEAVSPCTPLLPCQAVKVCVAAFAGDSNIVWFESVLSDLTVMLVY